MQPDWHIDHISVKDFTCLLPPIYYTTTRFGRHFFGDKPEPTNELCSPMMRPSFSGLPPALIIVAECDPLADQGQGKSLAAPPSNK